MEEKVATFSIVRDPMDIARAADDKPIRVLYLTFEEMWVFQKFIDHAKQVFDKSKRVAVSENDRLLMHQLELDTNDIDEETVRDIVERFEEAGIIERAAVTNQGDTIAYKFCYQPEDLRVVEIKRRPLFKIPKTHMELVRRMIKGEGPDPNKKRIFKIAFGRWLKEISYGDKNLVTLINKVRGYRPKDESDRKTLCAGWGIWYHDKASSRWLLAFEQFLPIASKEVDKPPIIKQPRGELEVEATTQPAESAPIATPATLDERIKRIELERAALSIRNTEAKKIQLDITELEHRLEALRSKHSKVVLEPEEEQRLDELNTTLRVLTTLE